VNGETGATIALQALEEQVMVPRLKEKYQTEVVPALMQEFRYRSIMQAPRIEKIVLNIGLGEAIQNSKALDAATADLAAIAGQKPVVTRARKSIAAFKVRQGMPIGVMVTLRGPRMWSFLDRLMNLVLPRLRDFRGVSRRSFDGRGNYSIGLREQIVFPEIDYDKVDKLRGLEVVIVTTAPDDEQGYALLKRLGMPFRD
jgi:large subunit ribosomal protein L5